MTNTNTTRRAPMLFTGPSHYTAEEARRYNDIVAAGVNVDAELALLAGEVDARLALAKREKVRAGLTGL